MSEPTRQAAIGKLNAFAVKIGYPDKWRELFGVEDRAHLVYRQLASGERV